MSESLGIADPVELDHDAGVTSEPQIPAFPHQSLSKFIEGMVHRPGEGWTIFPADLLRCVRGAAVVYKNYASATEEDRAMVDTLVSLGLPAAFREAYQYEHMVDSKGGWSKDVRCDMLRVCVELGAVIRAVLEVLEAAYTAGVLSEAVAEVEAQASKWLDAGMHAVSKALKFHSLQEDVPLLDSKLLRSVHFASPPVRDVSRSSFDSAGEESAPVQCWENLCAVLNAYFEVGTFATIGVVLRYQRAPMHLRAAALKLVAAAVGTDLLTTPALWNLAQELADTDEPLVMQVSAMVDRGDSNDFYQLVASAVRDLHQVLSGIRDPIFATAAVANVQRAVVGPNAAGAVFWRALAAAWELERMLEFVHEATKAANGGELGTRAAAVAAELVRDTASWMQTSGVVAALLRTHLHQAQFVAVLKRIMQLMTDLGLLSEAHLEALWASADRDFAFQAVRDNTLELVGALAPRLTQPLLHFLLDKVHRSVSREEADVAPTLDLLAQLVYSDKSAAMAGEVLHLLWSVACIPRHLRLIVASGIIKRTVVHYLDATSGVIPALHSLFQQLREATDDPAVAVPALLLLQQLLSLSEPPSAISQKDALLSALLGQGQAGSGSHSAPALSRGTLAERVPWLLGPATGTAARVTLPGDVTVDEVVGALIDVYVAVVAQSGDAMDANEAERISSPLFSAADAGLVDLAFRLVRHATAWKLLDSGARQALLDRIARSDLAALSRADLEALVYLIHANSSGLMLTTVAAPTEAAPSLPSAGAATSDRAAPVAGVDTLSRIELRRGAGACDGLPVLWAAYVVAGDDAVARAAQDQLIGAYTTLNGEEAAGERAGHLREWAGMCVEQLQGRCAEAEVARGTPGEGALWHRVWRVLDLLNRGLRELDAGGDAAQGRLPHAMAFKGPLIRLKVMYGGVVDPDQGAVLPSHLDLPSNAPPSRVKALIAESAQVQPEQVRILFGGRQVAGDTEPLSASGITNKVTVHAVLSYPTSGTPPASWAQSHVREWVAETPEGRRLYALLFRTLRDPRSRACRPAAARTLDLLWTNPTVASAVRDALAAPDPVGRLGAVLRAGNEAGGEAGGEGGAGGMRDASGATDAAWLAYAVETVRAIVEPAAPDASAGERDRATMVAFAETGCAAEVLRVASEALRAASARDDSLLGLRLASTCVALLESLAPELTTPRKARKVAPIAPPSPAISPDVARQASMFLADAVRLAVGSLAHRPGLDARGSGRGAAAAVERALSVAGGVDGPSMSATTSTGLAEQALSALQLVLAGKSDLVLEVLQGDLAVPVLVAPLLSSHGGIRKRAHDLGCSFMKERDARDQVMAALVDVLRSARELVDQSRGACEEYFSILSKAFVDANSLNEAAAAMIKDECHRLARATPCEDPSDLLVASQLDFVGSLVSPEEADYLGAAWRWGPSQDNVGLVRLLLLRFLFPETRAGSAQFLARFGGASHLTAPQIEAVVSLCCPGEDPVRAMAERTRPVCGTEHSRACALDCLRQFVVSSSDCLALASSLLIALHFVPPPLDDAALRLACPEHTPRDPPIVLHDPDEDPVALRQAGAYVGLVNAAATCYMNSVLQQLFMQPSVRRGVLAARVDPGPEGEDGDLFSQLQLLMAHLAGAAVETHAPRGFWRAFKDYDGEPIDVREHQDAFEFLTRLLDQTDMQLTQARQTPVMKSVLGGTFVQQVVSRGCSCVSETHQDFLSVSVDVAGHQTLADSLDNYVEGELLEGENAYHCSTCNKKVDALRRTLFKQLPHALLVHLKRFDYDFTTMARRKIRGYFSFPVVLDLSPYTDASARARAQGAAGAGPAPEQPPAIYRLRGVVVHSGTAFAGHYYSFTQERRPGGEGPWFCFDDCSVTPWDPSRMAEECFGGPVSKDGPGDGLDRPNSAYMLLYERQGEEEPLGPDGRPRVTAGAGAEAGTERTLDAEMGAEAAPSTLPMAETVQRLSLGTPKRGAEGQGRGAEEGDGGWREEGPESTPMKRPRTAPPSAEGSAMAGAWGAGSPGGWSDSGNGGPGVAVRPGPSPLGLTGAAGTREATAGGAEEAEAGFSEALVPGRCGGWDHAVVRALQVRVLAGNVVALHRAHVGHPSYGQMFFGMVEEWLRNAETSAAEGGEGLEGDADRLAHLVWHYLLMSLLRQAVIPPARIDAWTRAAKSLLRSYPLLAADWLALSATSRAPACRPERWARTRGLRAALHDLRGNEDTAQEARDFVTTLTTLSVRKGAHVANALAQRGDLVREGSVAAEAVDLSMAVLEARLWEVQDMMGKWEALSSDAFFRVMQELADYLSVPETARLFVTSTCLMAFLHQIYPVIRLCPPFGGQDGLRWEEVEPFFNVLFHVLAPSDWYVQVAKDARAIDPDQLLAASVSPHDEHVYVLFEDVKGMLKSDTILDTMAMAALYEAGNSVGHAALHLIHLLMFDDQAATQRTVYRWGSWLHHTEPVNTGHSASRLAQIMAVRDNLTKERVGQVIQGPQAGIVMLLDLASSMEIRSGPRSGPRKCLAILRVLVELEKQCPFVREILQALPARVLAKPVYVVAEQFLSRGTGTQASRLQELAMDTERFFQSLYHESSQQVMAAHAIALAAQALQEGAQGEEAAQEGDASDDAAVASDEAEVSETEADPGVD